MRAPQNGWFITENPNPKWMKSKMDDLGVPLFQATSKNVYLIESSNCPFIFNICLVWSHIIIHGIYLSIYQSIYLLRSPTFAMAMVYF